VFLLNAGRMSAMGASGALMQLEQLLLLLRRCQ
jgi:hypothetical protein